MNTSKQAAKEMFLEYCGSHFHMGRDGKNKEYLAFEISEAEEVEWAKERGKYLVGVMENAKLETGNEFNALVSLIKNFMDVENLRALLALIMRRYGELDAFTMIRYCEELLGIVSVFREMNRSDIGVINETKQAVVQLIQAIETRKFTMSPEAQASIGGMMGYVLEHIPGRIERLRMLVREWAPRDTPSAWGGRYKHEVDGGVLIGHPT